MKYILTSLLLVLGINNTISQQIFDYKRDHIWLQASGVHTNLPKWWTTVSNVSTGRDTLLKGSINYFRTQAIMCDTVGNFLFATNGVKIEDASFHIMDGCDTLNPGPALYNNSFLNLVGYPLPQNALILPRPGNPDDYYLIHESYLLSTLLGDRLYYTRINMKGNNGLGSVVSQNNLLCSTDFPGNAMLTACRHANGRDWWIPVPLWRSDSVKMLLLDPYGLHDKGQVYMGTMIGTGEGQAVFSPNGAYYIVREMNYNDTLNLVTVFNFDRCNGTFTLKDQVNLPGYSQANGCSVSPNSRFIYVTNIENAVLQLDLEAVSISSSIDTVAIWDGHYDNLGGFYVPSKFMIPQLAADGKIYINWQNIDSLHVINNPDVKGVACNLQQHSAPLKSWSGGSMPNYPNFRLGPIDASSCDSLSIDDIRFPVVSVSPIPTTNIDVQWISTYPNPTQGMSAISFHQRLTASTALEIYNDNGVLMHQRVLSPATIGADVWAGDWPPGVYTIRLVEKGRIMATTRLMKH